MYVRRKKFRDKMPLLPPQSARLVYGIIQSSITTAVASGQLTGIGVRFFNGMAISLVAGISHHAASRGVHCTFDSALRRDVNEVHRWQRICTTVAACATIAAM
jgi:hypothetical protein